MWVKLSKEKETKMHASSRLRLDLMDRCTGETNETDFPITTGSESEAASGIGEGLDRGKERGPVRGHLSGLLTGTKKHFPFLLLNTFFGFILISYISFITWTQSIISDQIKNPTIS